MRLIAGLLLLLLTSQLPAETPAGDLAIAFKLGTFSFAKKRIEPSHPERLIP